MKRPWKNYNAYLSTAEELDQKSDQVRALTNIGVVYNDMGRYDKGILHLQKALGHCQGRKKIIIL